MKGKIKILLGLLISCLLCFAVFLGCNKGDEKPIKEKQTLLFQIDAGLGGQGLTTLYDRGDENYKASIDNIEKGLKLFSEKFNTAVLINAQHSYLAKGYSGKGQTEPLDRVRDSLKFALEQFALKGIDVYLEMYSSDIGTNQNGELAMLLPPELRYGDGSKISGISMDLDTLIAIKNNFPAVKGIRFHELVGTNQLGWENNPHGYKVEKSTLMAIVDVCAQNGLKLVWSDHSWKAIGRPTYHENNFFNEVINYADEKLKGNLTMLYANNDWERWGYINSPNTIFPYKNLTNGKWGLNNQSWTWLDPYLKSSVGNTGVKYFIHSENEAPAEYMAAYTQSFLNEGADMVMFEPGYYFFNFHNTPWLNENHINNGMEKGHTAFYEEKPDFSPRLRMKRFASLIMAENQDELPSLKLTDYVDESATKNSDNLDINPFTKYLQTSLVFGKDGGQTVYDKYISNDEKWFEDSENRYSKNVFSGEIVGATRSRVWAAMIDDIAVIKKENNKNVLYFYNNYSGLIAKDENIFSDNSKGEIIGITSANLVKKYVSNVRGDTDELIIARKNAANISLEVYGAANGANARYFETKYELLDNSNKLVIDLLGKNNFDASNFFGVYGVGLNRQSMASDSTRPLGSLAVVSKLSGNKINILTHVVTPINQEVELSGELIGCSVADVTLSVSEQMENLIDEMLFVTKSGEEINVSFMGFGDYGNGSYGMKRVKDKFKIDFIPKFIVSIRQGFLYSTIK